MGKLRQVFNDKLWKEQQGHGICWDIQKWRSKQKKTIANATFSDKEYKKFSSNKLLVSFNCVFILEWLGVIFKWDFF